MSDKTSKDKPGGSGEVSDPNRKSPAKPLPEPPVVLPPQRLVDTADVRAGPGDAGATHQPTQLPPQKDKEQRPDRNTRVALLIAIIIPAIFILITLIL